VLKFGWFRWDKFTPQVVKVPYDLPVFTGRAFHIDTDSCVSYPPTHFDTTVFWTGYDAMEIARQLKHKQVGVADGTDVVLKDIWHLHNGEPFQEVKPFLGSQFLRDMEYIDHSGEPDLTPSLASAIWSASSSSA
jgi:hypothetical protein